MKKTFLTIAIVLGFALGTYAQNGGLFGYGETTDEDEALEIAWYGFYQDQDEIDNGLFGLLRNLTPGLPNHGENGNQNAPLGGGALLLIGFGAAYALKKKTEDRRQK